MRKLVLVLLVVLMFATVLFSGCSNGQVAETSEEPDGKETTGAETSEKQGEEVVVSESEATWDTTKEDTIVMSVINNYYTAGQKKMAEDYMKLHPETKVVIDVVADNDSYFTKLQTTLGNGDFDNAPDIVHGNFLTMAVAGGSWDTAFEKGLSLDMSPWLDEVNPYSGAAVRDAFNEEDIYGSFIECGGSKMGFFPFDVVSIAFFYNKTIFDDLALSAPTSWENLVEICATLKENGYEVPIGTTYIADWMINSIGDAAYRSIQSEFLVQPDDAIYNEPTMSVNDGFVFDSSNMRCDLETVVSNERLAMYQKENGIAHETNKAVWSKFYEVAQYFPQNWIGVGDPEIIAGFESQEYPITYNGSWNVGLLIDDINKLPEDMQFEWATFQIPSFENAPAGIEPEVRGLNVFGNQMSVVPKGDEDHMARVKDLMMYMHTQPVAQDMYETTLTSGNYVQGPPLIKGVELDETLSSKLDGFLSNGTVKQMLRGLTGTTGHLTQGDMPKGQELLNKFTSGEITVDEYLAGIEPLYFNYVDENIENSGFDLDPSTEDTAK